MTMICRGCGHVLDESRVLCDLGSQPLANALLTEAQLSEPEVTYPLAPVICERCTLVQLPESVAPAQLFCDYPYFSSQSTAFVQHARRFVTDAIARFSLTDDSLVVELASNDGYLLEHFLRAGIRCYGVEPARNVALHAIRRGVPTLCEFFSGTLVCDQLVDAGKHGGITGGKADLIVANNVLAHVPDLHHFLQGVRLLLSHEGVFTIEVPWLRDLVEGSEIGSIYHEHFSYFTLAAIEQALSGAAAPLRVFDVEHLDVHGGSLRLYACHRDAHHAQRPSVAQLRSSEERWLADDRLSSFATVPGALKRECWRFLTRCSQDRKTLAGYCAAAKASTMLSYCGIGPELLAYIADTTPAKQGRYMPGSRIPIVSEERLEEERPDVIWILAPNWASEIVLRLRERCDWGPAFAWQDGARIVYDQALGALAA